MLGEHVEYGKGKEEVSDEFQQIDGEGVWRARWHWGGRWDEIKIYQGSLRKIG